jgi:hypothetical protein
MKTPTEKEENHVQVSDPPKIVANNTVCSGFAMQEIAD